MKIIKELIPYIIIIIVVVLIRMFVITPAIVNGKSMETTLYNKDVVLLKKYDRRMERFDIVVFQYGNSRLVKRVIGLPGEHVKYENNTLYINDKKVDDGFGYGETKDFDLKDLNFDYIPENYYFLMGDNRNNSTDSRVIGLINKKDILGETSFRIWPLNKIGTIR